MPRMSLWPLGGFFVALLLTVPVAGQTCRSHAELVEFLKRNYNEIVRMRALDAFGRVIEVFAAPANEQGRRTWTFARTAPGGPSCMLTEGNEIEFLPPPAREPGQDAQQ